MDTHVRRQILSALMNAGQQQRYNDAAHQTAVVAEVLQVRG